MECFQYYPSVKLVSVTTKAALKQLFICWQGLCIFSTIQYKPELELLPAITGRRSVTEKAV